MQQEWRQQADKVCMSPPPSQEATRSRSSSAILQKSDPSKGDRACSPSPCLETLHYSSVAHVSCHSCGPLQKVVRSVFVSTSISTVPWPCSISAPLATQSLHFTALMTVRGRKLHSAVPTLPELFSDGARCGVHQPTAVATFNCLESRSASPYSLLRWR